MIRIKSITSTKRLDWDPKRVNNYNSLTAESQRTLRLTYFFALREGVKQKHIAPEGVQMFTDTVHHQTV
jgi:hypothetical protein